MMQECGGGAGGCSQPEHVSGTCYSHMIYLCNLEKKNISLKLLSKDTNNRAGRIKGRGWNPRQG